MTALGQESRNPVVALINISEAQPEGARNQRRKFLVAVDGGVICGRQRCLACGKPWSPRTLGPLGVRVDEEIGGKFLAES